MFQLTKDFVLTFSMFLCYYFAGVSFFFYLICPYLVPQIIHTIIKGKRFNFNWEYIVLFAFVRNLIPLYLRGCPYSIFRLTPSVLFIFMFSGFTLLQVENKFWLNINRLLSFISKPSLVQDSLFPLVSFQRLITISLRLMKTIKRK